MCKGKANRMTKAIIFDLDNTLIDFMGIKKMSCEAAVSAMIDAGVKLDQNKALKILFGLYDQYGIEYNKIFQKFLLKINRKIDYKILSKGIVAYRKVSSGFLHPYPGVYKTLLKLKEKGLKLAIVSDAPRLKAWTRLCEMNIDDFFDVVVAFGDTKEKKPSKLPFEKALKELNLKPSEVLMVGDNPERDILGAKRLGMKTVLARYGNNNSSNKIRDKIKADYEINRIEELLRIV